jgi:hypothetical protein
VNHNAGPVRLRLMRLAPFVIVALVTVGAVLAAGAGEAPSSSHTATVTFTLDHFLCYPIKSEGSDTPTVKVDDQFKQPRKATVVSPQWLCNWAEKEGSAVRSRRDHLLCYSTTSKESFSKRRVKVTNQFKAVKLLVLKPNALCLPSGKSPKRKAVPLPKGLDHFQCYPVRPITSVKLPNVEVHDEFGSASYAPLKPFRLCNPARKNGSHITNKHEHLLCYAVKPLQKTVTGKTVWITNQFAKEPLAIKTLAPDETTVPQLLCLPSLKTLLP